MVRSFWGNFSVLVKTLVWILSLVQMVSINVPGKCHQCQLCFKQAQRILQTCLIDTVVMSVL